MIVTVASKKEGDTARVVTFSQTLNREGVVEIVTTKGAFTLSESATGQLEITHAVTERLVCEPICANTIRLEVQPRS
jgi:hypothetical protein